MKFADNEHRQFFEDMVQKTGTFNDNYRLAVFYVLGILPDTRRWINDIYNFEERTMKPNALKKAWQTSGNIRVTRMAFNLFNGFDGKIGKRKIDDPEKYTPYALFDSFNADYFLEAIKLLNGVYKYQVQSVSVDKESIKHQIQTLSAEIESTKKEGHLLDARTEQTR